MGGQTSLPRPARLSVSAPRASTGTSQALKPWTRPVNQALKATATGPSAQPVYAGQLGLNIDTKLPAKPPTLSGYADMLVGNTLGGGRDAKLADADADALKPADPDAKPQNNEAPAPGQEKSKGGKAKLRKTSAAKEHDAEQVAAEPAIIVPAIESSGGSLQVTPLQATIQTESFRPAIAPESSAPPRGKSTGPNADRAAAVAVFREAIDQSAGFYAEFLKLSQFSINTARAAQASSASQAQGDLGRGLAVLRNGLDKAMADLDRRSDLAANLIEVRRASASVAITAAARSGLGTLNAHKKAADAAKQGHDGTRVKKLKDANTEKSKVGDAGRAASAAVLKLDADKAKEFPIGADTAAMKAAINEAVGQRLPERSKDSAKAYDEELAAQETALGKVFGDLNTELEKQFTALGKAMHETASSSAGSIVRSRDAARKQLASGVTDLKRTVRQSRARGRASLVTQHNSLRRNLIASHRDRAARAALQAQQLVNRGVSSALSAARGQQAGVTAIGDSLRKETARSPGDLAKFILSSARTFLRQTSKSSPEQRGRIENSIKLGNSDAQAQAQALVPRLDRSADDASQQLLTAATGSVVALDKQIEQGTQQFTRIAPQVSAALKSVLPATIKAYKAQTEGTAEQPGMAALLVKADATITATLAGSGGGQGEAGQGAGAGGGAAKGPKEKPAEFRTRATAISSAPKTDSGIANLEGTAKGDIPPRVQNKVGPLYDSLKAFSTPVEAVMEQLRGLTPGQGRALAAVYLDEHQRDLAAHLRSELWKSFSAEYTNEQNINAALAYLAGKSVEGANAELKSAVYLWNDTGRSEKVMRSLTPVQLDELRSKHPDTLADVSGDLEGGEKTIFDALKEIKPVEGLKQSDRAAQQLANFKLLGVANAYALKTDLDRAMETKGEEGGDKAADAVSKAWQTAGSDAISGGDGPYEDPAKAEIRRLAVWLATDTTFAAEVTKLPDGSDNVASKDQPKLGAIARYAAAARNYTQFVPDDSENGGHYETVKKGLDPRQAQLIDDIAKTGPNSEDTAASTIEFETNRQEGKPREDRLRKALLGDDLMAARESESDPQRAKRLADQKGPDGKVIVKGDETLARERKDSILKKVADRQAEAQGQVEDKCIAPKSPKQVQDQIVGKLDARFSGDPSAAAYTKSMIESPTLEPDAKKAFDFALAHKERNKETLIATTGRMTRKDVLQAVGDWEKDNKTGEGGLYKRLGMYGNSGDLEGDARNEVEIAFRGKPQNEKDKALIAIMVVEQQHRDSGASGRTLANEEYKAMIEEQSKVLGYLGVTREQIDKKGDIKLDKGGNEVVKIEMDDKGQLKGKTEKQRDNFESAMRFSHMNAESYKQAVDRIAQGIVMALVVAAAVITTFVTFGGAAAFWGPVLITAAAGFAGMALTAMIRGDRYTSAEMQRDFVMTLVQAATAGIGSALGAGAKGAGAAAKEIGVIEKGAEAAAKATNAGEKLAAGAATSTATRTLTMGEKAFEFGKTVMIGGGSSGVNSFAAAAMDPENRRQGKSLSKAIDGGIKGFISGSIGAALNKPMSALGRPLGKVGERIAGNVGGGFVSRLADARVGQALGDPHQSWAESIEGAKEGIAQDAVQAFGEHHAEQAAERRAIRKVRAAQAAKSQSSEPAHLAAGAAANDNGPQSEKPHELSPDEPSGRVTVPGIHGDGESVANSPHQTIGRAPGEEPDGLTGPHPSLPNDDAGEFRSNNHSGDGPSWKEVMSLPTRTLEQHAEQGNRAVQSHRVEATADLTPEMLRKLPAIPEGSVIRATDPKSFEAALRNYHAMLGSDPHNELLLAFHPQSGDYAVIKGNTGRVGAPESAGWIGERHVHPQGFMRNMAARILHNLPSGIPGDFGMMFNEVRFLRDLRSDGNVVTRASHIDVVQPDGSIQVTTFSATLRPPPAPMEFSLRFYNPQSGEHESFGPRSDFSEYRDRVLALTNHDIFKPPTIADADAYSGAGRTPAAGGAAHTPEAHRAAATATEASMRARIAAEPMEALFSPHAAPADRDAAVRRLGLTGAPDSLARLTALINEPSLTPAMRSAIADATLSATRADLVRSGALAPGDDVVMLFRGVTAERRGDYEAGGIDLARLGPGRDEDAGRGLYGSQDLQSAMGYTGGGADGRVLPLIVRRSELGNVIDVRSGTPLGDRWLAYVRATAHEGRLMPGYEHLSGVLHPGVDMPIGLGRGGRGARFEDFLRSVAADPTAPPAMRVAAADPHITFMDLGGVASWGNDRGMLTDQFAMHHQRVADLFNEAHGFPMPGRGAGGGDEGTFRSLTGDAANDDASSVKMTPEAELHAVNQASLVATDETAPVITAHTVSEAETPHLVAESTDAHGGHDAEKAFLDAVMEANAELHAPKPAATTYREAMDGASNNQRRAWQDRALAEFAMAYPKEFNDLRALMGNDPTAVRNAIMSANGVGRERQILYMMARMTLRGVTPLEALNQARLVIGLASDMHHRLALVLRNTVEQEIWRTQIENLPAAVRTMAESSNLLLYLGGHHPALLQSLHADFLAQANLQPLHITAAHFEEFVARELMHHPVVQAQATGRRIVRFSTEADFNLAAKTATPHTRYEFGRLAYTTDFRGRTEFAEGVPSRVKGHRGSSQTQADIGNTGTATDVGFHLIAHIFGAVVNELTVVPGNGYRIPGDPEPNLNGSAYKVEFENIVRNHLDNSSHIVEIRIQNIYNSGNLTNRPDTFLVTFRTDAGEWVTVPFVNKF